MDMVSAGRAEMRATGALWGFRTREELMENGAESTGRGGERKKQSSYLSEEGGLTPLPTGRYI